VLALFYFELFSKLFFPKLFVLFIPENSFSICHFKNG